MKKYFCFFTICLCVSFGIVFGAPEDQDATFQTFNEIGITNANIAANGVVNVSALTPDGKLLIGGDFTLYKGVAVNRLARINSDGTLDTSFNPVVAPLTTANIGITGGVVNSIAIAPGETSQQYSIIVGGTFTKFNNTIQNRLAKIDCNSTTGCRLDTTFVLADTTKGANGAINTIAFAPGGTANSYDVIIGGAFAKFNNLNQNNISRIACIVSSGTQTCTLLTNAFTTGTQIGTTGAINSIAVVPGGTNTSFSIIIGGALTKYNNISQKYLSQLDCTGTGCTLDTSFVGTTALDGANNSVNAVTIVPGGDTGNYSVILGGVFTKINNVIQNRLTKIDCTNDSGSQTCSVDQDFVLPSNGKGVNNGAVESIVVYNNGVVVIGGSFTAYDGVGRNRLAQLEVGGELDQGFYNVLPAGPDNTVQHLLIQTDGKIIVSGLFDGYNGLVTGRITRLLGMTSSYSAEGCGDGLFYCGFDNSCVASASQCASCPADFTQQTASITPTSITPKVVPAVDTWGNLADSPTAHAAHAMVVMGTKIYVFGGYTNNNTEVYDVTTNTWQTLSDYPGSTNPYGMMAAAYGGKIYTFYQKKTYEYNPANDTWLEKAPIPTSKAQGSAEVIDDKIYIVSSLSDKKFHIYDPIRNRWTTGPDIPVSTHYAEGAVANGKIYILGGTSGEHGTHKMVHVYDPCVRTWRKIADTTTISATHSATSVKGEIYMGGGVPIMDRTEAVYKIFRKYNPITGATTSLPDMPFKSYHARSVAVGNMIYALGGCGTSGLTTQYCVDKTTKFAVYNTGATNLNVDENISACYCKAACGEGKYYSLYDNVCKPAHELTTDFFCNKNNICELGESCNCGDCVNGGFDDRDACGISAGVQMYCSRDQEFYFPETSNIETFTGVNKISDFLSATKSTTFSYEPLIPIGTFTKKFTTRTVSLGTNAPTIKWYSADSSAWMSVSKRGLSIPASVNKFPANSYYLKNPSLSFFEEKFDFIFDKEINAFGIEMYEPIGDNTITGCNVAPNSCIESEFTFELYRNGTLVDNTIKFYPENNKDTFFGFSSPESFDEIRVRETKGNHDNEFFGRIYYQDRSAGVQQCETKKVIAMNTSNGTYASNNATMFFDFMPREVTYDGKKVYVYKILKRTTASKASIIANPSEAYKNATDATNTFDFIEANLTTTNAAAVFNNPAINYVNGKLLGRLKTDGTIQYQYNDAGGGYPFFARTPYKVSGDKVYSQYRDDAPNSGDCPGGVCYALAPVVGVFDVQVCQSVDQDVCTIGACCPAGKKWDCDTNACIVDEFMCPAGQIKTTNPGGAVCLLSLLPKVNGTDFILNGYDNLQGNCTLASSSANPLATISPVGGTGLSVGSSINTVAATTSASFATILDPTSIQNLLTCPSQHKAQCFLGDGLGQFSCGCFPEVALRMKVNIVESENVNTTVTLGNGVKVQNNTFFDVYKNNTYALDTGFETGDTTDMGVNRQQGYVEFYTHDRIKYQNASGDLVPARLRGTITLEGAKIIGINAPYQRSVELYHLESSTNDFATQINDNTVSFHSYFAEPGDKWKIYYEIPTNLPEAPEYTCQIQGCAEGQYWCSDEGACKNAGEACGAVTCNNDLVCDTEESCDCADCNGQIDHCGLSDTGQQLYCIKDISTPTVCQSQAETTFNLIEAKLAPYLSQVGNLNIAAGEFGTAQTEFEMTQDTRQDNAPSFTKEESWSRVKELLLLPSSVKVLWTRSSQLYSNSAYGGSLRYVHSFVIPDDLDGQKQITYATEYLPAYGWRKIYLINKDFPLLNNNGQCVVTNNNEKWEAYSYSSSYIFLAKHPISSYITPGTFQVYNPERIISNMTKEQFLANPTAAINNARVVPIGNTRTPISRLQFNIPQLLSETQGVQTTTINNLKSSIANRFLCKTLGVASTDCHVNNLGAYIPAFSYSLTGPIYGSLTDSAGGVTMVPYQRFGTFEVPCQPYDYTSVRYIPNTSPATQGWSGSGGSAQNDVGKLAWQINDATSSNGTTFFKKLSSEELKKFFSEGGKLTAQIKNISSGTMTSPGSVDHLMASYLELSIGQTTDINGNVHPRKRFTLAFGMDALRTPTVYAFTDGQYNSSTNYQYTVSEGIDKYNTYEMIYDTITHTVDVFVNGVERISNYPGNVVTSGNLQPANQMTVYFGSGSSAGIAKTNYGDIKLTLKNNACLVSSSAIAQIGACCPAGAEWSSDESKCIITCLGDTTWDATQNKCVPNGCAEGQYYCHAEKICKPANQSCGTVTCNNNSTCDFNESCDCADCNGQKDHCGMVGGQQLYCAPDPAPQCYTDRFPYCFPICLDGYALGTNGQCVLSGGTSLSASSSALTMTQVGACCPAGAQWSIANNRCETNCNTTQAPSELKAGVDQPYISCTAGPSGTTHFRYRLTDMSAPTAAPFISNIYSNGTPVLHSFINTAGDYKVECFYGNATSVDTDNTATPSTCVKNIVVKNDPNTQGCEGLVSYKGTTLVTTLEDTNVFTARFQCINRVSENPSLSNPFRIQYATNNFINLGFATVIDPNLSSSIGLNRLSAQDQYSFQPGTTSVTCAVKVGDGYSTNTSCQKNACVGSSCSTPQTFSVIHSDNLTCTTQATAEYKIGCNPDAPESNRTACVNWLTQMAGTNTSFKAPFIFNGTLYGDIACNKYGPNDPALGGVNMQANIVCRATLNNGQQYTILAADSPNPATANPINSLQTTTYTVKKDSTNPELLPLELYLNPNLTLQVTDFDRWYNVPVTLVARCNDKPGISDGDECACSSQTSSDASLWSPGVPHTQLGPDIMYYARTISTSTNNITAQVKDTAGNLSNISPQISLNIDTQPPIVAITETGSGASRTIQLSVTDTNSKIWTNSSIPSGGQNNGGLMYRTGPKANTQSLMLDNDCGVGSTSLLPTVAQTVSIPSNKVITIPNINVSNTVVTYCVKDNAGNVTRGSYPTVSNACFSASNMSTVPNFDTYKDLLRTRIDTNKYGYSFSENSADAQCFRGILANNVATLLANQLTPRTETDLDWSTSLAFVRNTNNRNTNGYYYYSYSANNTLKINTSPSDSGTKTVVVDGGNIQITQDINYSGTGKLLVLIARKNNNGQGGNILIDPAVSNIDAIMIADGGALINTDINALGERLTINGRIYSYNTRGGSLTPSGSDLVDATSGKQFNNSTLINSSQFSESRAQDLERFRIMTVDGNTQCSLHVNYQVLTNSQLPPILQRPTTFGASCGF